MSTSPESDMEFKTQGLPAYLVLDTSGSMKSFEPLLNSTLLNIYDTLFTDPQTSEFIHLSVVSFNTEPYVVTPMTDIQQLESLPTVFCTGLTNVGPMLQLLRTRITDDVRQLSSSGVKVLRPVVFLLTDGLPTDKPTGAWKPPLDELQDRSWRLHPHIITYGFGQASESVLRSIATVAAFVADEGPERTAEALSAALASLLSSLVASAREQQLQIPQEVAGYRSVPMDFVG